MKATGTIFILAVICVSIGVLWYIGQYTVSVDVVPSLQEYMASTTSDKNLFASTSSTYTSSTQSEETSDQKAQENFEENLLDDKSYQSSLPTSIIQSPKGPIRVFVAKNPESREHGLSGYPKLDPDQGMLFIFPVASTYSFWMKDMNFPIDIIWMNSDRKIIEIHENVSPESYPELFSPKSSAQFVLEVSAGAAQKQGLEPGITLMF